MKIKFNSDDDSDDELARKDRLELYNMAIVVRSLFMRAANTIQNFFGVMFV